ncbi:MAG TPA: sigma-70 family RNA polymerase sigma factor [Candidatus Polarisedimenticolaceae bacterium]|nr:sigma-70 family RNA polymerase sigma factor [Candidatus Polarisedimenticolaceae bacterium]
MTSISELDELTRVREPQDARERELEHARDLRDARRQLIEVLGELPSTTRTIVLDGVPPERDGHWPIDYLEACYLRLARLGAARHDDAITPLFERARELRRRLHRAREALVVGNLALVPAIVRRYDRGVIPFADLVQEGHVGLIKAVDRFDPDRGYRFSTYASWWIRSALSDAFTTRSRLIRLPESLREKLRSLYQATARLEQRLGRRPTVAELAERMAIPQARVKKLTNVTPEPSPIDELALDHDERWRSRAGRNGDDDPLALALRDELTRQTGEALARLDPREREVIRLRFGFGHDDELTLAEIGERIGLSRERVRQIERGALLKLHAWALRLGSTAGWRRRASAGVGPKPAGILLAPPAARGRSR